MTDTHTAMTAPIEGQAEVKSTAAWKRFAPLAVVAGGLVFAYAMGWHRFFTLEFLAESREAMTAYVASNYALSAAGFTVVYAIAVAFSFPAASILTIFAGFLFGWLAGGLMVAIGATAGATAIFLVARSAFGDFLKQKVGGRVKNLAEGFEKEAFSYLLILRLAPVFPFFIMNIAPALFNVPIRTYVIATLFGILPGTFAYTFLGQGVGSVLEAAEAAGTTPSVSDLVTPEITIAFVALAAVATIPVLIKRLRKQTA
ncbi:MAG: TVP38/TMEM64 family protein [Pseudomonadota bacterium]